MQAVQDVPQRLGRYQVLAKLGEGGMATVYLARRLGPGIAEDDDPVVAVKVIKPELSHRPDFTAMFLDEIRVVASLRHPSIVRVLECGSEGGRLYYAMELVLGQSLWHTWEACRMRRSRLRYDLIAWIGARVAEGLHHAHEMRDEAGRSVGFVHRDVTPSNILVTYDGRIKIIDFGLAKAQHRLSKTGVGILKGKYAYMAPEQAQTSQVDRRTDVFALGVTLWEVSCDRRLFKRKDDIETLIAVGAAQVPDPCGLVMGYPRPLWRVLRRAMRREPDKRYPTALDMARELDEVSTLEGRRVGPRELAAVMNALFAYEAERDSAWVADASLSDAAPFSVPPRNGDARPSARAIDAPEEWKRALPPGLLAERSSAPRSRR